jgi:hypothetical protein
LALKQRRGGGAAAAGSHGVRRYAGSRFWRMCASHVERGGRVRASSSASATEPAVSQYGRDVGPSRQRSIGLSGRLDGATRQQISTSGGKTPSILVATRQASGSTSATFSMRSMRS